MRTFGKWLGRILLALVVAIVVIGLWKREQITRLLAVNSLFSQEKIVQNFSHMDAAFLSVPLPRGDGPISELAYGPEADLPAAVEDWIVDRTVTALVVLKNGEIVYENYFQGTRADDRRISWSMATSYLSVLVGILIEDGKITSLDDPVTKYAPLLKGGAYDGASLRNVLQMASGVSFDEDYLDFNSDINRMGRVLALGGKMDDFAAGLTARFAEPGQQWQYVSIDTHVVGMVVRGATGRSITDLLSEMIIVPLGLENTPYYLTDGVGTAFVLGGLNMTTPSAPTSPGETGYGLQWWIPIGAAPGEYMARGIYGQYIYIDTARGVVIATNAADRNFRDPGVSQQNEDIFRLIASSL